MASDLSFCFGAQLKNLNDVEEDLANKVVALGANAILNFKYEQKSRWLAIDDVPISVRETPPCCHPGNTKA